MRVFSDEDFVIAWNKGKISWFSDEAIRLPVAIKCPHCKRGIVLSQLKEDQSKTISFIMDGLSLFIPTDTKPEQLEKMWNDVVRPAFFQWLHKVKQEQTKKEDGKEA